MAVSDVLFGYLSWYRLYDAVSPNTLTCIVDLLRFPVEESLQCRQLPAAAGVHLPAALHSLSRIGTADAAATRFLRAAAHKTGGRNLLVYTDQAVSRRLFKQKGVLQPPQLKICVETQQKSFDQVRIVPRKTHYVVEVVYSVPVQPADGDPDRVASLDLRVDNLAAVTFNQPDLPPLLVNGRPLKAINQFYNKERARLQSLLADEGKTSRRIESLTDKRNRRVKAYLHLASRRILETLVQQRIGTLVIGQNNGWKQEVNLGSRTNQSFVQIPHARFIDMLTYKAQRVGIQVQLSRPGTHRPTRGLCRQACRALVVHRS